MITFSGLDPEAQVEPRARDRRRPRAADHHLELVQLLALDLDRVEQPGPGDDRRAVLVVVEHRDVHPLLERLLDVKALRRLDVLEVDPPERRLERRHGLDEVVRALRLDLDVEHVDVGELLEEHPLALHHRLARQRPDVPEPEHRRPVRDHRDEVPARRILEDLGGSLKISMHGSATPGE
jgi:hypothetical protein